MEAVLKRPAWPPERMGFGGFGNWLICWLLLPNLPYALLWLVGGPPRGAEIILTGCVGVALHRAPFALKFAAFTALLAYSAAAFTAGLFNLKLTSLADSIRFAGEMQPAASPQYVLGALAMAATLVAAWWLLRRPTTIGRPMLLVAAVALTIGLGIADRQVALAHGGSYARTATAGAPFASAVQLSGFGAPAHSKRHLLLVMVESMGQPTDAALRERLVSIWARPELRARYDVTSGSTPFYGSTTSGEMRELCGRWGDYHEVLERADPSCLPAKLQARGYRAQAWHSFTGAFFERTRWYPHVGFSKLRFGEEMRAQGAAACPGVFPGACDDQVPAQIADALQQSDGPQFLYWLTVNSHLPLLENEALGTTGCDAFDPALQRELPMTCRLLQLFDRSGRALAREIVAEDFPATDILIVGDHLPPFIDRRHRQQFEPDRVPWILLRAKTPPRPGFDAD